MALEFLGTGSAISTPHRNVSSLAFHFCGGVWIFDCGDGTARQLYTSSVRPGKIECIFITHLHGDHVLWIIPGCLLTMRIGEQRANEATKLFAPLGVVGAMGGSIYNRGFKHDIHEICPHPPSPERVFKWSRPVIKGSDGTYTLIDDERFLVRAVPILHSIFCLGFVIEERLPKIGKLDAEKIERVYKLPPGPLYKELARGNSVVTPDGHQD